MRYSALALLLCACGLDESGLAAGDAGLDVANADGASDAPVKDVVSEPAPPLPCSTPPGACVASLPAGWTLLAFDATASASCPANFTATNVASNPKAQTGACDCACAITASPACDVGSLQRYVSNDTSCGTTGVLLTVNGGGCTAYPNNTGLSNFAKSTALAPTGGTCSATPVTNVAAVTTTPARACAPPTECQEQFCGGDVPAGFSQCIVASGPQAQCPAGFGTSPRVVGDSASLACSACACDVNGASSCTNASLDLYGGGNCGGTKLVTMPVDGNCDSDSAAGSTPTWFQYHATLSAKCNATGPKTPTVGLANVRTVCCKP